MNIRQQRLKEYIEAKGMATIREMQALLPEVSLMTIHRDLDLLESRGILVKFRGGAKSVRYAGDPEFAVRMRENNSEKLEIAEKAMGLLQPHTSVFLDASTTNLTLARNLPDIPVNIITTGPNIAIELCRLHNPTVTLCCGLVNRKSLAVSGHNTLAMMEKVNIDMAFIGVSGCSAEAGFTCGTEADAMVKRLAIQKAHTSVVMCGIEKFNRLMPYTFAMLDDVDYMVTNGTVPAAFGELAKNAGVKIL